MAVRFPQQPEQPLGALNRGLTGGLGLGLNIGRLVSQKREREQALIRAQKQERLDSSYKALDIGLKLNLGAEQLQPHLNVINENLKSQGLDVTGLDIVGREKEFYTDLSKLRKETDKSGEKEAGLLGLQMLSAKFPRLAKGIVPEIQALEKEIQFKENLAAQGETPATDVGNGIQRVGLFPETQFSKSLSGLSSQQKRFVAQDPDSPLAKRILDTATRQPKVGSLQARFDTLRNLGFSDEKIRQMEETKAGVKAKSTLNVSEFRQKQEIQDKSAVSVFSQKQRIQDGSFVNRTLFTKNLFKKFTDEEKRQQELNDRNYKAALTQEIAKTNAKGNKLDSTLKLKDRVEKDTADFRLIQGKMNSMRAALKEAKTTGNFIAVDQALITIYNKILDPKSTVRVSEYARSAEDLGLIESLFGKAERITVGGAGLTKEARSALNRMAEAILKGSKKQHNEDLKTYDSIINEHGLNREQIIRPILSIGQNFSRFTQSEIAELTPSDIKNMAPEDQQNLRARVIQLQKQGR